VTDRINTDSASNRPDEDDQGPYAQAFREVESAVKLSDLHDQITNAMEDKQMPSDMVLMVEMGGGPSGFTTVYVTVKKVRWDYAEKRLVFEIG
jgi:hypothetical protein